MATSTPGRKSPQVPPAAPRRTRKPSAKVLEVQQSLGTRTKAQRSAQNEAETIVVRSTQDEPPPDAPQPTQDELPPFPTARAAIYPEHERGSAKLEEAAKLIAGLKETIAQQSSIIGPQHISSAPNHAGAHVRHHLGQPFHCSNQRRDARSTSSSSLCEW